MDVCAGITRKGTRCTASVSPGAQWCYNHDPERQAERSRNARRGGKAKASGELAAIKARLSDLADDVLGGAVDKGVAAVASQVLNVYLRAVSVELKAREQLELIERLEALEEALQRNNEAKPGRQGTYGTY
jgi:hypothetical protein